MNLEQFLKSTEAEHAIDDIRLAPTALAGTYDETHAFYLERNLVGPWQCIELDEVRGDANLEVYYRELRAEDIPVGAVNFIGWTEPPVGRYIVTDLGHGNRALKLRTGAMEGGQPLWDAVCAAAHGVLGDMMVEGRVAWCWNGGDIYMPAVEPADLPKALCRVLLAARRVAFLEAPC